MFFFCHIKIDQNYEIGFFVCLKVVGKEIKILIISLNQSCNKHVILGLYTCVRDIVLNTG